MSCRHVWLMTAQKVEVFILTFVVLSGLVAKIYVVDSSDKERIDKARDEFQVGYTCSIPYQHLGNQQIP